MFLLILIRLSHFLIENCGKTAASWHSYTCLCKRWLWNQNIIDKNNESKRPTRYMFHITNNDCKWILLIIKHWFRWCRGAFGHKPLSEKKLDHDICHYMESPSLNELIWKARGPINLAIRFLLIRCMDSKSRYLRCGPVCCQTNCESSKNENVDKNAAIPTIIYKIIHLSP